MATSAAPAKIQPAGKFPAVFWFANFTELIERSAFYSMAPFMVIYLGELGLGTYWPAILNTVLWFLIYFLPVVSGTISDQVGFRRALLAACVLLGCGYAAMGSPIWLWKASLSPTIGQSVTAGPEVVLPVLFAILMIGIGGSIVKPCILGTTQKVAGERATLAYALFYLVVNIGALVGRGVAYYVRTHSGGALTMIFGVAALLAVVAFVLVAGYYKGPETAPGSGIPGKPHKSVREIIAGMLVVMSNRRFVLFLLISCGFYFLYNQFYVAVPLYLKTVVEPHPAMDLYTIGNPLAIVCLQLVITKHFGKLKPIRSMMTGAIIMSAAMALNILPIVAGGSVRALVTGGLPLASLVVISSFTMCAFAELFTSPRMYEYIGAMAPKGQEGLFSGYANLPLAVGSLVGGPVGALIFNEVMARGAVKRPDGLLELVPAQNVMGWALLMGIGLLSAVSMWLFNRWLEKTAQTGAVTN